MAYSWKLLDDGWYPVNAAQESALANDLESIIDAVYGAERRWNVESRLDAIVKLPIGGERLA